MCYNRTRLVAAMVLLVGPAAAASILMLQRFADRYREAEVTVGRIQSLSLRLKGYQDTVLALPQTLPRVAPQVEEDAEGAMEALQKLDEILAEAHHQHLRGTLERFHTHVRTTIRLVKQGRVDDARTLNAREGAESYKAVDTELTGHLAQLSAEAKRANLATATGSAATVLLATAMMGYRFYRFDRVSRHAERLAAEQRTLQASEAHFRSLVRNGWDVIVLFNPNGTVLYASPAVERVLGYAQDAFNGRQVYSLIHPDDAERGEQLFERAVAGVLVTYHDISEQKAFEAELTQLAFRSFVQQLGQDRAGTAIVQAIITLAKSLELQVTGEGVETSEQAEQLLALGCDRGQGYRFARPQPAEAVGRLLGGTAA